MKCHKCLYENTEFHTRDLDGFYNSYYMHYNFNKNIVISSMRQDSYGNDKINEFRLINTNEWPHQWVEITCDCANCMEFNDFNIKFTDGAVSKILRFGKEL